MNPTTDDKTKTNIDEDIQRRLDEIAAEGAAESPIPASDAPASAGGAASAEQQPTAQSAASPEEPIQPAETEEISPPLSSEAPPAEEAKTSEEPLVSAAELGSAAEGGETASSRGQTQLSDELKQVKKALENQLQHLGYTEEQIRNEQFYQQKPIGYNPLISALKRDLAVAGLKLLSSDSQFVASISTPHQVGKFILAIIAVDAEIEGVKQSESKERPSIFASRREVPSSYNAKDSSEDYQKKLKQLGEYADFSLAEHPNPRTSSAPLRAGSHLYFYAVEALRQIWPFYFTAEEVREQLNNSLVIPDNQMAVNVLRHRVKNELKGELAQYDNKTSEKYRLLITQALAVFKLLDCYAVGDLTKRAEMLGQLKSTQNLTAIQDILTRSDNRDELNILIDVNYKEILEGKTTAGNNLTINLSELPERSAYSNLERVLREALRKVDAVESAPALRAVP